MLEQPIKSPLRTPKNIDITAFPDKICYNNSTGKTGAKVECVPSIDGNKLLIYKRAAAKYESVGVVDFLRKSYTAFSCEDMNDVDGRTAYWFDHESVIIEARSDDNSGKDYYIYRISSE